MSPPELFALIMAHGDLALDPGQRKDCRLAEVPRNFDLLNCEDRANFEAWNARYISPSLESLESLYKTFLGIALSDLNEGRGDTVALRKFHYTLSYVTFV